MAGKNKKIAKKKKQKSFSFLFPHCLFFFTTAFYQAMCPYVFFTAYLFPTPP
jgi:hypothetical protein